MYHRNALNSYQENQIYEGIDPRKLILMLYDGALLRIAKAKQGVIEKNCQKRGENLGKAIAIINELNASLDKNNETEEIKFLQGLYNAILAELPKASFANDTKILDRAFSYIKNLKKVWKETVMENSKQSNKKINIEQFINIDKEKFQYSKELENHNKIETYVSKSFTA